MAEPSSHREELSSRRIILRLTSRIQDASGRFEGQWATTWISVSPIWICQQPLPEATVPPSTTFKFVNEMPQVGQLSYFKDYPTIKWHLNTLDEVLATVCGNSIPEVIASYSNEVDLIFQTGSRVYNRQGFRLTFNTSVDGSYTF